MMVSGARLLVSPSPLRTLLGLCLYLTHHRPLGDEFIFQERLNLYRAGNHVERFFNRIKHCRRIAARYDKLAANFLAFLKLAAIRLWLGVYESTS